MRVLVAPDSFGGTLSARQAAEAIAEGWHLARPDDEVERLALADGGEGTLDVLAGTGTLHEVEVAGPHARPVCARWLLLPDGLAVVEAAEACGLRHLGSGERAPLRTTSYGVGQLLEAARAAEPERLVVGLGGSATVDGGAGALLALGLRLLRPGGDGLKVGGGELTDLARIERGWFDPAWKDVDVELWADVWTDLGGCAARFGPQKGATPESVVTLERGLETLARALERDLGVPAALRDQPGAGAAGGLGYGLAAVLEAPLLDGAAAVARRLDLGGRIGRADLVVTGEGRLDATSLEGKVVGHVLELARTDRPVLAVAGQVSSVPDGLRAHATASREGPGEDPYGDVRAAARELASRWT